MAEVVADMAAAEPLRINTISEQEPTMGSRRISVTMGTVTTVSVPGRDGVALPVDVTRRRISSVASVGSSRRGRGASEESVESCDAPAFVPVPAGLDRKLSTCSVTSAGTRRPSWVHAATPDAHWYPAGVGGLSFGDFEEIRPAATQRAAQQFAEATYASSLNSLSALAPELTAVEESLDHFDGESYKPPTPPGANTTLLDDPSAAYNAHFGQYWSDVNYMMQMSGSSMLLSPYMTPMGPHPHMGAQHHYSSLGHHQQAVTTLMLRNIPQRYNREMILEDIDARGFCGSYDFFYLPIDFSTTHSVGYAFINFINEAEPLRFKSVYDRLKLSEDSPKVCEVCDAKVQGKARNVEFYRNSTVMGMDEQYHPVLLDNGVRLPFPQPTRALGPVQRRPPRAGGQSKQQ